MARFAASHVHDGFDRRPNPDWLMCPVGGTKTVRLFTAEGLSVVSLNERVAKVTETGRADQATRTLNVKGIAAGTTHVEVRRGATVVTKLEVAVKALKTVKIAFNFVRDSAGHHTRRSQARVDSYVQGLNDIYLPQVNIKVTKHSVRTVRVAKNLRRVVRFSSHLPRVRASQHEWNLVTATRDRSADFNLFFVWEYEQDATPLHDDAGAGTSGSDCIFEDHMTRGTDIRNLGHEMGHYLGCDDTYAADKSDLIMYGYENGGTGISKAEANTMNP